ncbi:uncharacterized protein Dwil_GK22108 [Drosophila willistoni]|uniref:Augmin complex subunit dgt5 n=1 Tax=Drosophila willistoni TaxID=7260 RepID=B4MYB1_DROWI|nr:augmin complex subunit dgt5 [Drosophila willistoni]EDW77100.1 uncharacterized protein Dwil_GK22108 [Drosophila willistoni]
MSLNERIESFRTWATNMGCPPKSLPTDQALKNILKSGQSHLFEQLQARIQPHHVVQQVRQNLLIAEVAKHKDKLVPMASRSFLPIKLQTHLRMQELQQRKEKADRELTVVRKEYEALAASIKSKSIQCTSAKHKRNQLEARNNMLELKLESMNKTYEKELRNKTQILSTIPVSLNSSNGSEKEAMKAVELAIKELEKYYEICDKDGSANMLLAKQNLWSQMRNIFAGIPHPVLFSCVMKIKEQQLQHVMELNKTTLEHNSSINKTLSKPRLNNFDKKLLKTKGDLLAMVCKYLAVCTEVNQLEERFAQAYGSFVDELQRKVNAFNGLTSVEDIDNAEEIISDFLVQYNMRNFNTARNDYLAEEIERLRLELETGAKQLENHELLLGSIKQVYGDINTSVNRIQHEMLQLSQIKGKILYSKNIMKNRLDDMQAATQNQNAKSQLVSTKLKVNNMSLMGMESFTSANDTVFCSTKLEFDDNTILGRSYADTTVLAMEAPNMPCHLLELNTFAETPMDRLSCIPKSCLYMLSANPLIVEAQELASTVQLAPGHLLTPYGALQEVRKRILWASAIAAHTSDLKFNLEPLIVDPHDLKLKSRRQNDEITELLDNMKAIGAKTQYQVQKVERLAKFIQDNPMRRYVPPTKRYNNASFNDFESEYTLYLRMTPQGAIRN